MNCSLSVLKGKVDVVPGSRDNTVHLNNAEELVPSQDLRQQTPPQDHRAAPRRGRTRIGAGGAAAVAATEGRQPRRPAGPAVLPTGRHGHHVHRHRRPGDRPDERPQALSGWQSDHHRRLPRLTSGRASIAARTREGGHITDATQLAPKRCFTHDLLGGDQVLVQDATTMALDLAGFTSLTDRLSTLGGFVFQAGHANSIRVVALRPPAVASRLGF
jgi:hypothetical protein